MAFTAAAQKLWPSAVPLCGVYACMHPMARLHASYGTFTRFLWQASQVMVLCCSLHATSNTAVLAVLFRAVCICCSLPRGECHVHKVIMLLQRPNTSPEMFLKECHVQLQRLSGSRTEQ
jgi:hypothetical protein